MNLLNDRFLRLSPALVVVGLLLCIGPAPAHADWLVMVDGTKLQTEGPWQVQGRRIIYTDVQGKLRSLRLSAVDLAASERATELKGDKPDADTKAAPAQAAATKREPGLVITNSSVGAAEPPSPPIVLYSTSWCGYCRKARKMLADLGADFVEKDIERSAAARREHQVRARGRGVPLLDFDGTILRGYSATGIERLVDMQRVQRAQASGQKLGKRHEP